MRRAAILLLCAVWLTDAMAQELLRIPLDDAASLATTIRTDTDISYDSKGSIRIDTSRPTTLCLAIVEEIDIEEAKLVYSAKVRSRDLQGAAFLELWCHVGGGTYFSRGVNSAVNGTKDWKRLSTPFLLQAGENPDKLTLNLVINGKGTVWVDDIRLYREPLQP